MPEINPIPYNPTLEAIAVTPELESIMVQAIKHVREEVSPVKLTVRWQFWMRQAYDLGMRDAMKKLLETPAPLMPLPEDPALLEQLPPEDDANE